MIRLDDIHNSLHDRGGREELAVVVRLLNRELGEEVLIDAAEDVAGGELDLFAVEQPHQILEHLGLEDAVVLWQDAQERLELALNGRHRLGDELGQVRPAHGGLLHNPVVLGLLGQVERAPRDVVRRQNLTPGHLAAGAVCLDLFVCGIKTIGGVTEKDHSQHRHKIIA